MFAAAEPEQAVGLLIVLGLIVNLMTLGTEGRRPQPLVRDSAVILAWAVPGVVAGVLAAARARLDRAAGRGHARRARHARGAGGRAAASRGRRRASRPAGPRPVAGFASGALTTSTNTAGPPVVLYLLARGATPVQTRDTLTVTFIGLALLGGGGARGRRRRTPRTPPRWRRSRPPPSSATCSAARSSPASPSDRYEPVLTAVLLATALAGLLTALL